jgi:hypothetical protein
MARFRYVIADVFTDSPLQGNQVAVFTDAREIPEDKLQRLARETNLSETVLSRDRARPQAGCRRRSPMRTRAGESRVACSTIVTRISRRSRTPFAPPASSQADGGVPDLRAPTGVSAGVVYARGVPRQLAPRVWKTTH